MQIGAVLVETLSLDNVGGKQWAAQLSSDIQHAGELIDVCSSPYMYAHAFSAIAVEETLTRKGYDVIGGPLSSLLPKKHE